MSYLADIFAEVGGPRRTFYFGDLDPQGLLIPQEASGRAQANGLPSIEPHLWSYRQVLTLGTGRSQPWDGEPRRTNTLRLAWRVSQACTQAVCSNRRLAQEHVGWEFLQNQRAIE